MQNKLVSLVVGFIITLVVVIVLVVFLGRASEAPQVVLTDSETSQQATISDIKSKTDGLVNYGDLPKIVTKDDIERSNPFESY